jgi:hypothetical protein
MLSFIFYWYYYHTNGNGDSVYFDNLGWPWEIHSCWNQYWKDEQTRKRVIIYLNKKLNQDEIQKEILAGALASLHKEHQKINLTELEVANFMGLSLARLRASYGHLYQLRANKIALVSGKIDFSKNNKSKNQDALLKRKLEWGISSIPNLQFGQFGIYGASEKEIASSLGSSISSFREKYGWLYVPYPDGIRFVSRRESINEQERIENLKSQATRDKLNQKTIKQSTKDDKRKPKSHRDKSKFKQPKRFSCPHCEEKSCYAKEMRLHIQKDHGMSSAQSILSQAENSQGRGKILCLYCCKTGSAKKIVMHLKYCQVFSNANSNLKCISV